MEMADVHLNVTKNSFLMTYQSWHSRPVGFTRKVGVSGFNNITISGNGLKVKAMVVDECDSMRGCDEAHDY
ncbi:hypothetical protein POTOM_046547 [Populus tomentosa]|uniref:Uncharacterized protein n=1 Tax=Populus tomentosa TaxID=118781 RepID=A0A8X8C5G2_POPTO|nr:hypothetical protein POTOM_046547 [Populus tomentosa]